jgi:hypothetical protein
MIHSSITMDQLKDCIAEELAQASLSIASLRSQ